MTTRGRYLASACMLAGIALAVFGAAPSTATTRGTLPLGALVHDGPATPEQLSLIVPVTGALPTTATANLRYRASGTGTWLAGHPLHRIRSAFAEVPGAGSVPDAFAWPIIDLTPGTAYDVEVTVVSGAVTDVLAGSFTTRALPVGAGAPNKHIAAGATLATIQAVMNALNPGDVIELANGTYNLTGNIQLTRSGSIGSPIHIRGASRDGVVLSRTAAGRVFQVLAANHVIIENLSIQGTGVDSGTDASSVGIEFWNGAPSQTRITVRNVTMRGVDIAIKAYGEISEFIAYDNSFFGNNTWTQALITTNATWNDDGICLPGFGNVAFNNTLRGFGDSFAYTVDGAEAVGVHFYRNDIRSTGDDAIEGDYAHRNLSFYDNRVHNSATLLSLDPLYGGPLLAARNISINTQRSPFKFNSTNTGQFIYNNTIVRTTGNGAHQSWGWVQFNNGPQRAWGYRNNELVYQGTGDLLAIEAGSNDPIDFTHNSWFPDGDVWWSSSGGSYSNLAMAYAGLPLTTPVFGSAPRRHEQDNITTVNPWTTNVALAADFLTEVTATYLPTPAMATAIRNTGVAIAGITDGFSGVAPDRGAIIGGRMPVAYGDRSEGLLFANGFE